jgi:MraZ protein
VFLGEYQHSLDAKGRIILPSRFRARLESGLVITRGLDGCLWVMPQEGWNRLAERLSETSIADPRARNFARFVFSGASEVRPDRQGRLFVAEHLRKHAGLERDVVVMGAGDRIEIWSPERWERRRAEAEEHMEEDIAGLEL